MNLNMPLYNGEKLSSLFGIYLGSIKFCNNKGIISKEHVFQENNLFQLLCFENAGAMSILYIAESPEAK